jgi:NADH:ubiquinone oxidoreductase subunit 5 (subunit L)/multisubunit Na+/H+ antiporter MnhA subunit
VEYRTKSSELDELGGLGRLMPLTYISCLIASLSISGIPPFNGFVSKWLIYQGLILRISNSASYMQIIFAVFCLIAAMFGSVLTLASFIKLLHAVFLGQRLNLSKDKDIKEVKWTMWIPCIILAAICVLFGVFAFSIPLKYFIFPAIALYQPIGISTLLGTWVPTLAALLIIIGLLLGLIIFKLGKFRLTLRQDSTFVGGETTELKEENMVTGIDFYNSVKEMGLLPNIYKKAAEGCFDIYEQGKNLVLAISKFFQILHNGVLPSYLVWILLGAIGLFLVLFK